MKDCDMFYRGRNVTNVSLGYTKAESSLLCDAVDSDSHA